MILTLPPHLSQVSKLPRPAHAPYLHPCRQYRQGELMRSIKRGCPGAYRKPASTFVPIGQDVPVPRSTRMCGSGQVMAARRSAGVWFSSSDRGFLTLPRFAGVTCTRYLLFGAKTPRKRVRLTLGLGTNATSLEMAVPAHPCAHGIPYILYIISSGSNMTWVVPLRQGVFNS